jgi:hypothetical protein
MIETLPIRSKRFERAARVQTVQHAMGAMILIYAAWDRLTAPIVHHLLLAVGELTGGLLLLGSIVFEKLRHRQGKHGKVGWVELAGGVMATMEAIGRFFEPHTLALRILGFVPAILLFTFGLFDVRLRSPQMRVDDDAFSIRWRMLRQHRVPWAGLSGYRITPGAIELIGDRGNVRTLKITSLINREEALAWAEERFLARGLAKL